MQKQQRSRDVGKEVDSQFAIGRRLPQKERQRLPLEVLHDQGELLLARIDVESVESPLCSDAGAV